MSQQIDTLLARLAAETQDRSLYGLEAGVWRQVALSNGAYSPSWRGALAAISLVVGIGFNGAVATAEARTEISVFSPLAPYSPSSLIGIGR